MLRALKFLFNFELDESGVRKLEQTLGNVKNLAIQVGKVFGIYFAIDKIKEYVSEIFKAGKEMNRLNTQINNLARPMDDAKQIQTGIYDIAQKLGVEYKDAAETMRSFLIESQNSKRSQEELLRATENVHKALVVSKASAEQVAEAHATIDRALRLGSLRQRGLGTLLSVAPELVELFGKPRAELEKLAKSGKLTADMMIEAFGRSNAALEKQFEKMPVTLFQVFTKIRNELAYAAAQIWKVANGFSFLGKIVWAVFSTASRVIQNFIRVMGGLEQVLQVIGIALTLVIGPLMLRYAVMMTMQFVRMAIASWAVWAPWIAIGAAIVLAALAIHDLMVWMSGDKETQTVFGDLLGPFEEFKQAIEDFPLVRFASAIQNAFKGDWGEMWNDLKVGILGMNDPLNGLITLVSTVAGLFVAWNLLKFTGLLQAIGVVKDVVVGLGTAAQSSAAMIGGVGATGLVGALIALAAIVATIAATYFAIKGVNKAAKEQEEAGVYVNPVTGTVTELTPGGASVPLGEGEVNKRSTVLEGGGLGKLGGWLKKKFGKGTTEPGTQETWTPGSTAPGAQVNDVDTTLNQTNNISVTAQFDERLLADLIESKVAALGPQILDATSRAVANALPRTESAIQ